MNKYYLKSGKWLPYKISQCPNCEYLWNIRLYHDNDNLEKNEFFEETNNFNKISEFNKETKIQKITHICNNCNYSFSQEYKILSEQELLKKITQNDPKIDFDSLTSNQITINQTISGKNITVDKIEEIIKNLENNI